MSFNPRSVEAKISLGWLHPEDLPSIAWDALEAGYEGQSICLMAGLKQPSGWETDKLLPEFLRETGMKLLSKADASIYVAGEMAREILESRKDLLSDLPTFARLCYESNYPKELMSLYELDDEVYRDESTYGRAIAEVRADVRDELVMLVRSQEIPRC